MNKIAPELLLAEFDLLVRSTPTMETKEADRHAWCGHAMALFNQWNPNKAILLQLAIDDYNSSKIAPHMDGRSKVMVAIQQARNELRLQSVGPLSVPVDKGGYHDFFDEIRKLIETAQTDILFVDRYMGADFVPKFLPYVRKGVTVRLLTYDKIYQLQPAAEAFKKQSGLNIEIRETRDFHDRFLFIDKHACYQSGASFKDGGSSPTTITQMIDVCDVLYGTHDVFWNAAKVVM